MGLQYVTTFHSNWCSHTDSLTFSRLGGVTVLTPRNEYHALSTHASTTVHGFYLCICACRYIIYIYIYTHMCVCVSILNICVHIRPYSKFLQLLATCKSSIRVYSKAEGIRHPCTQKQLFQNVDVTEMDFDEYAPRTYMFCYDTCTDFSHVLKSVYTDQIWTQSGGIHMQTEIILDQADSLVLDHIYECLHGYVLVMTLVTNPCQRCLPWTGQVPKMMCLLHVQDFHGKWLHIDMAGPSDESDRCTGMQPRGKVPRIV